MTFRLDFSASVDEQCGFRSGPGGSRFEGSFLIFQDTWKRIFQTGSAEWPRDVDL